MIVLINAIQHCRPVSLKQTMQLGNKLMITWHDIPGGHLSVVRRFSSWELGERSLTEAIFGPARRDICPSLGADAALWGWFGPVAGLSTRGTDCAASPGLMGTVSSAGFSPCPTPLNCGAVRPPESIRGGSDWLACSTSGANSSDSWDCEAVSTAPCGRGVDESEAVLAGLISLLALGGSSLSEPWLPCIGLAFTSTAWTVFVSWGAVWCTAFGSWTESAM